MDTVSKLWKYVWNPEGEGNEKASRSSQAENYDQCEQRKFIGSVTGVYDGYGMIDNEVYFSQNCIEEGRKPQCGDKVQVLAVRKHRMGGWKAQSVTYVSKITDQTWLADENQQNQAQHESGDAEEQSQSAVPGGKDATVGMISNIRRNDGYIEDRYCFKLTECLDDYAPCRGDWVCAKLSYNANTEETTAYEVKPLRETTFDGKINTVQTGFGYINTDIYFTFSVCEEGYTPRRGHRVCGQAIESTRGRNSKSGWRALSVCPVQENLRDRYLSPGMLQNPLQLKSLSQLIEDKNGIEVTSLIDFGKLPLDTDKEFFIWIRLTRDVGEWSANDISEFREMLDSVTQCAVKVESYNKTEEIYAVEVFVNKQNVNEQYLLPRNRLSKNAQDNEHLPGGLGTGEGLHSNREVVRAKVAGFAGGCRRASEQDAGEVGPWNRRSGSISVNTPNGDDGKMLKMTVLSSEAGLIIGRQGVRIRELRETTGAGIRVHSSKEVNGEVPVEITGEESCRLKAKAEIDAIIASIRPFGSSSMTNTISSFSNAASLGVRASASGTIGAGFVKKDCNNNGYPIDEAQPVAVTRGRSNSSLVDATHSSYLDSSLSSKASSIDDENQRITNLVNSREVKSDSLGPNSATFVEVKQNAVAKPTDGSLTPLVDFKNLNTRMDKFSSEIPAFIAYAESPSRFYIQLDEEVDALEELMESIQAYYFKLGVSVGDMAALSGSKNRLCAAKYSLDSKWYRAKILSIESKIKVFFVDYGNSEYVGTSDVKEIPAHLMSLPAQAIECCLFGIEPVKGQWSTEAVSRLEELAAEGVSLTAVRVSEPRSAEYLVDLKVRLPEGSVSLAEALAAEGHGVMKKLTGQKGSVSESPKSCTPSLSEDRILAYNSNEVELPTSGTSMNYLSSFDFKTEKMEIGHYLESYITHFDSLGSFYLQLQGRYNELEEIMAKIQSFYNNLKPEDLILSNRDMIKGRICVAKFDIDDKWYRAKVLASENNQIKVDFVDFGNCDYVSVTDIREITAELRDLPAQAIECCLFGIKPIGNDWSEKANFRFEQLTLDEIMVSATEKLGAAKYAVAVKVDEQPVHEVLIAEGLVAGINEQTNLPALSSRSSSDMNLNGRKSSPGNPAQTLRSAKYTVVGGHVRTLGTGRQGISVQNINYPLGVAVSAADRSVVVCDSGVNAVKVFSWTGEHLCTCTPQKRVFERPACVLINKVGDIFVKDDSFITVFNKNGDYLRELKLDALEQTFGMVFDPEDNLVVYEWSETACRLVTLNQSGDIIKASPIGGILFPSKCRFMDSRNGTMVISNLGSHKVYIMTLEGKIEHAFGEHGEQAGCFVAPTGIAMDSGGSIFVCDSKNNRIQTFDCDGNYESGVQLNEKALFQPSDIFLTEDDYLVVSNFLGHCVKIFKIERNK